MTSLDDIHSDYELLEPDDRYRLLIDLGRDLEPMPDALKTDATLVRGCSRRCGSIRCRSPTGGSLPGGQQCAITKGSSALVLLAVQDRRPRRSSPPTSKAELERFDLKSQLSSNAPRAFRT
jgi:cysteine desulfuration protein SufE